uniref:Uncharacterized protein n=1 Tax=Opuntia streptacantha TaxID=393608 RepID=A0A7C8YSD6_OPUST
MSIVALELISLEVVSEKDIEFAKEESMMGSKAIAPSRTLTTVDMEGLVVGSIWRHQIAMLIIFSTSSMLFLIISSSPQHSSINSDNRSASNFDLTISIKVGFS